MNVLHVTYCSEKKNPVTFGTPKHLYNSRRISSFIKICESMGQHYAILSAKYGLFFPNEIRQNYHTTFHSIGDNCRIVEKGVLTSNTESSERFQRLVQQIRRSIQDNTVDKVKFYCSPPLLPKKCYVKLLHVGVDACQIDHKTLSGILRHITQMVKEGKGKIKIITTM